MIYDYAVGLTAEPVVNDQPSKFVIISGAIDPNLSALISIRYKTTIKACERPITLINRRVGPRIYDYNTPIIQASGEYKLQVPIDKIMPGICHWEPISIQYEIVNQEGVIHANPISPTPLIWFSKDGANGISSFEVECGRGEREYYKYYDTNRLLCRKPLGDYSLNTEAKELHVNFKQRDWTEKTNSTLRKHNEN